WGQASCNRPCRIIAVFAFIVGGPCIILNFLGFSRGARPQRPRRMMKSLLSVSRMDSVHQCKTITSPGFCLHRVQKSKVFLNNKNILLTEFVAGKAI
ncbi:hypothetical protein AHF37_07328, partial [Paragonimus kellicotti]